MKKTKIKRASDSRARALFLLALLITSTLSFSIQVASGETGGLGYSLEPIEYTFRNGSGAPYLLEFGDIYNNASSIINSTLSTTAYNNPSSRNLVRTNNGTLFTVYEEDPDVKEVWLSRSLDNGATWDAVKHISYPLGGNNQVPSIAVDSWDNLHVVWAGGVTVSIYYSFFNTSTWSVPIVISSAPCVSQQLFPAIAIDSNDFIHVVWKGRTNAHPLNSQIIYANYTTSWSTPLRISTLAGMENDYQENPSIAIDSENHIHVAFLGQVLANDQVYYVSKDIAWGTPVRISTLPNMHNYPTGMPSISVESNDVIHVVFHGKGDPYLGKYSIYETNYTDSWSTPYRVSTTPTMHLYDQRFPTIAIDEEDILYVVWDGLISGMGADLIGWHSNETLGIWSAPKIVQINGNLQFFNLRWARFPVPARVDEVGLTNVTIYDADGSLNDGWLYKGEIYNLEAYVYGVSYVQFNFTDGINIITFRYYNQSYMDSIAIRNQGSMEFVASVVYSEYEVYSNVTTRLLWRFILENNIVDSINVEWNYLITNDIFNVSIYTSNVFQTNIYNLGNKVYYEYSSGGTGHITGGHPYEIYATNGTSLEWAKAYVLKRRWQHFHSLFAWDLGDHECADHDEESGYIQFGTQIRLNGTYQSNYRVNLYIVDGAVDPFPTSNGKVYVKIKVEWMNYNASGIFVVRKTDYISAYYDGGDMKENRTTIRLWVDMWFSDLNSSTVVAGRVNSYYYGMVEKATYLIWTGWKPFIAEDEVSTFYDNFRDSTGQIISSTDVELVRHWALVQKLPDGGTGEAGDEDCDTHIWSLTGFREYHHKVADDRMMGIGNPPYEDTKIISMPQSGFVATIYRAIESMGRLVWLGAFNFLKVMWGAMGTFAGWLGIDTSIFSYIFEYIGSLPNIIISMMGYLSAILQYIPESISRMFSVILATIGSYLFMLGMIVDTFLSFWRELTSLFTGGWFGVRNMWEELSLVQWIQLALIGWVPFWWLDRINRSKDGFGTAISDVKTFLNSLIAVFYLLKDVLIFIGNLISKIWEILPL